MNGGLAFHVIQLSKPLWAIAFFEVKPRQPHRCETLKRLPESKTCMRAHSRVLEYWTFGFHTHLILSRLKQNSDR